MIIFPHGALTSIPLPIAAIFHEHARNEHALSHGALAGAGDLEALARVLREAVQVQAVVPVGPADQGQAVGAQMGMGVAEAPAQMLHQGLCSGHVVVKGNRLVQDRPVTGLPQIGGGARNEPERAFERLRYPFGGDRPSQTPRLALSHHRITVTG